MNLKEKAQKVETRNYEQITNDAEKYLVAAVKVLQDEDPGEEYNKVGFGGTDDFTHVHIIIDDKSVVVLNRTDERVSLTLEETDETVELNEKDAAEVIELILDKLPEKVHTGCPAKGLLSDITKCMLVMPLVLSDLRKAGRNSEDVTPRELKALLDKKVEEIQNSKD